MKLAFDRIAQILFDAGLLNDQVLAKDLPSFIWDSAIASGWWRFAGETRTTMFPERLGRYWVWRDDSRNWDRLFVAKTAAWQARLLEASTPASNPAGPPKAQTGTQVSRSTAEPLTPVPVGTRWEDIEISFLSDERVQIQIGSRTETRNYDEMGFSDRRNGTPSKSWMLLRALASKKGLITVDGRRSKEWPAIEKQIERTRKLLQKLFGISEDPLPFERDVGYRSRCKIGCARSFDR
jgi:hypothetical protein